MTLGVAFTNADAEANEIRHFDPHQYEKYERNVPCPAIRRDTEEETAVEININYVDIKPSTPPKETLLMVHGWPGMWSTWARQITHFQDDYRLLVTNIRGFYKSTHPGDVHTGGVYSDFVSDLICLMDHAGVESAICVGHDWGSQLCFEAARQRPDRFKAVIGLVVPYLPVGGNYVPTRYLAKMAPRLAYQAYFNDLAKQATEELDKSVRRSLRAVMRGWHNPPPEPFLTSTTALMDVFEDDDELEPIAFLSPSEEDYLVKGMEIQGFEKTLQFYLDSNRRRSFEFATAQGNHTIHTPSLLILPSHDRVAKWRDAIKLVGTEAFMTDLEIRDVEAAHWPHLEAPEDVNRMMEDFLGKLEMRTSSDTPSRSDREEL
ncbi:hypothetical protein FRC04_011965 [Tulasnella sp. 424]|nr:hypothetical protein FRC04_011965 [Tulasnella sp. 424]KAG8971335.1 hypothetical protein FRC05_011327 [Tulasnella sp. 425]